jgi:hypothetical protein
VKKARQRHASLAISTLRASLNPNDYSVSTGGIRHSTVAHVPNVPLRPIIPRMRHATSKVVLLHVSKKLTE